MPWGAGANLDDRPGAGGSDLAQPARTNTDDDAPRSTCRRVSSMPLIPAAGRHGCRGPPWARPTPVRLRDQRSTHSPSRMLQSQLVSWLEAVSHRGRSWRPVDRPAQGRLRTGQPPRCPPRSPGWPILAGGYLTVSIWSTSVGVVWGSGDRVAILRRGSNGHGTVDSSWTGSPPRGQTGPPPLGGADRDDGGGQRA